MEEGESVFNLVLYVGGIGYEREAEDIVYLMLNAKYGLNSAWVSFGKEQVNHRVVLCLEVSGLPVCVMYYLAEFFWEGIGGYRNESVGPCLHERPCKGIVA